MREGGQQAERPSQHDVPTGLVLDAAYQPVAHQCGLDFKAGSTTGTKELWLLQLPADIDLSQPLSWAVSKGTGGVQASCELAGVGYRMVEDNDTMSMQCYAAPSMLDDPAVSVARRMTVLRTTNAPQVCFGTDAAAKPAEGEEAAPTPSGRGKDDAAAAEESPSKKSKKSKRKDSGAAQHEDVQGAAKKQKKGAAGGGKKS